MENIQSISILFILRIILIYMSITKPNKWRKSILKLIIIYQ